MSWRSATSTPAAPKGYRSLPLARVVAFRELPFSNWFGPAKLSSLALVPRLPPVVMDAPAERSPGVTDASKLRRALAAHPWLALEVLVAEAFLVDGEFVTELSVRSLARELG